MRQQVVCKQVKPLFYKIPKPVSVCFLCHLNFFQESNTASTFIFIVVITPQLKYLWEIQRHEYSTSFSDGRHYIPFEGASFIKVARQQQKNNSTLNKIILA